jgi:hypothetical protein
MTEGKSSAKVKETGIRHVPDRYPSRLESDCGRYFHLWAGSNVRSREEHLTIGVK